MRYSMTMRSGSANGSGRNRAAYTMLNIVVVAPMPIARIRTARAAAPRMFLSVRPAYRTSCQKVAMARPP